MAQTLKRLTALFLAFFLIGFPLPARAAEAQAIAPSPLAAGFLHSAVLKNDGSLWAAGSNAHGQIGAELPEGEATEESESSGDEDQPRSADFVKVMDNVQAIYAGCFNTFAIDREGILYGWGTNEDYLLGLSELKDYPSPTQILENVSSVAPGQFHTAAVLRDGSLLTWGWNDSGQLGDGSGGDADSPRTVLDNVRSVSVGLKHTMAVKNDNTLWASGDNTYGQLADGGTESAQSFHQVMDRVQSVACTSFGTLILKTDGTLWACGYNAAGDLGNGTTENIPEPAQILENVSRVAASKAYGESKNFSAAISREGTLYAWGSNAYGQYGQEESLAPLAVAEGVTDVSLGGGHMLYLLEDGSVLASGNNEQGQLGRGNTKNVSQPEPVTEDVAPTPKPVSKLPLILTTAALVLAILGIFAFLIVRTLRGGKTQKRKDSRQKQKKEKKLSDRELFRLAKEMEREQRSARSGNVSASFPPPQAGEKADSSSAELGNPQEQDAEGK